MDTLRGFCIICNKPRGRNFDHQKCSKELQKLNAGKNKKKRRRKLHQKGIDYLASRYT